MRLFHGGRARRSPLVASTAERTPLDRTRTALALSSVFFAVLWTALMMWWAAPLDLPEVVILVVAGSLAGLIWHLLYGRWYRWYVARCARRS